MLLLSTKDGPVSTGLPPPRIIPVLLKEIELCHGHVALNVGLLVDGELDLAVLDSLGGVRVQVEGADLGGAAGLLDRLEGVQGDAVRRE